MMKPFNQWREGKRQQLGVASKSSRRKQRNLLLRTARVLGVPARVREKGLSGKKVNKFRQAAEDKGQERTGTLLPYREVAENEQNRR